MRDNHAFVSHFATGIGAFAAGGDGNAPPRPRPAAEEFSLPYSLNTANSDSGARSDTRPFTGALSSQ